jgi:hypothetical protein
LGIPYGYKHAAKIEAYAGHDRNHGGNERGHVDLKDDVTKPPEEEYEGDMDKPRDGFRHQW